jgi:hypothetical protein
MALLDELRGLRQYVIIYGNQRVSFLGSGCGTIQYADIEAVEGSFLVGRGLRKL